MGQSRRTDETRPLSTNIAALLNFINKPSGPIEQRDERRVLATNRQAGGGLSPVSVADFFFGPPSLGEDAPWVRWPRRHPSWNTPDLKMRFLSYGEPGVGAICAGANVAGAFL